MPDELTPAIFRRLYMGEPEYERPGPTTVVHWDDREPGFVYIGRKGGGYFGNPFVVGAHGDRVTVLERYREYFRSRMSLDPSFRAAIEGLRGRQLVCHCKPRECHGDVIKEYLDALP